jgi:hypothetical protein
MDKELSFDIQLFAEEPVVTEPTSGQPATEPVVNTPNVPAEAVVPAAGGQETEDFDWQIDPATGKVVFDEHAFDDKPQESEVSPAQPPAEEKPAEEPPEQKYTVKVNGVEQEVTLNELLNGYMMHSDYSRKTKELAEQRRQFQEQAQQAAPQQPQGQAQQQEPPKVDPKEYYKQLSDYAVKQVEGKLGEQFDEYNAIHQTALADEISTIKAQVYERNVNQQRIASVYQRYAQDPNFREIDNYAAQRLQELPYKQAVIIQNALRSNNAEVIDGYMGAVRDEWYQKRGYVPAGSQPAQIAPTVPTPVATPKTSPKPPFAEPTGAQQQPKPVEQTIDYKKLGKLTLEQQALMAQKLGLG